MVRSHTRPSTHHPVQAQNELLSTDAPAAARFYDRLLGWQFEPVTLANGDVYLRVQHGGPIGGIVQFSGAARRPHRSRRSREAAPVPDANAWAVFITVKHLRSTVARARKLGAHVLHAHCPVPGVGAFARLVDPSGAVFYLWQNAARRKTGRR